MATERPQPLPWAAAVVARSAVAGLSAWMAIIHLHLWDTGYRNVHIIGILFLLNGIFGLGLAIALLVVPSRLLGATAAATTLFIAGTLLGLILSLTVGLFGFDEFAGAPFLNESIVVEAIGIVLGAALCAAYARSSLTQAQELYRRARPGALTETHAHH